MAVAVLLLLVYAGSVYIDLLKNKKENFENESYAISAADMQRSVAEMILLKKKATVAIALSIADNKSFVHDIAGKKIDTLNYEDLISKFREHTLYKNIWIQVFDKDANALYRSWSDKKGDNLFNLRKDLQKVIETKKIVSSINPGKHDLSIRAIIPLFEGKDFIGMLEVISHFNSISKSLKKSDTDSVVLLKKEYKEQLQYPATKLFIDDYYVANFDAPLALREYLKSKGVENYLNSSYKVENHNIIVSYELKDVDYLPIGYIIMSKDISNISNTGADFYIFKWISYSIIILMGIAIIISSTLFYTKSRDKVFYENIINTSNNIIVINDKNKTINVNKTFFKYFKSFKNFELFRKEHECISDFFVKEKGCIQKQLEGESWIEYLLKHTDENHKVKMKVDDKVYYFSISASVVQDDKDHFAVIMSDITKQENYKKELEHLSVTDSLTGIGNRRFFQQKIEEECARSKRYKHMLSMIIFDIDHFKQVNDKYGHAVGDEVLIEYSRLISSMLRENDVFCRIGGEEFAVILPHANLEDSLKIAEKFRESVESSKKIIPITMSFGLAEYIQGESVDTIFKRADKALYDAKESGRNKVVVGHVL
ncbi:diguanylate cyclase [bacterium]|nr:diguanylate cyclase [bacterium]MBU1989565.1 diguanylate cyclase [bacterium]